MFERWIDIPAMKSCLIVGPRRSGKTTLLKWRYPRWPYVTLDDLDHLDWAKQDPKGFISRLGGRGIIDEIQRLPKLTVAVKYAVDNEDARFLMTGSSTLGLLDAAADTLAGRMHLVSLPTACWGEDVGPPTHRILDDRADPFQIKAANRLLAEAMTCGQFPEVLSRETEAAKHEVLVNYRNTYFIRDLMQLSNIENLDGLLAVFQHLARSIGSHLEVSNFARESGLSQPTTKKYLNALQQSQLTFRLYGYQFGPAKRFVKAAKSYFCDNGIIHSINPAISEGQQVENFVLAEFEKRRKLGLLPADRFYYYKSAGGHEIDLVCETEGVVRAVEVKATRKPGAKDIVNLKRFIRKMDRPAEAYLFYMGDTYQTVDGIRLVPIAALYRGA
jgi:predicted AAA+ superfamily ATPase